MSSNNELYNVSKYTEQELYNILDISNPTDRELEARILHLIRKYDNIQNEDGTKLKQFFENIYDHFFQDEDDEIEGFDTMTTSDITPIVGPTAMITIPGSNTINDPNDDINTGKTNSQLVTQADYVPDNMYLNPLLKQTIKRIICIDSQYRDVNVYPNTNNFAFDLSEPLRDVVSLKLYSIQIPYTWYTISKNYGSNFFYLKAVTDGINNKNHDYRIEITPGNYDSNSIVAAVNAGFKSVFSENPDTSFNNTNISYNSGNSISTITVDIQKVYTESYYTFQFPYWTPSTTVLPNGNTTAVSDVSRNTSIPAYLGFNYASYSPTSIFSNGNLPQFTTQFINNDTKKNFMFDNSNNYFTVIQYLGPNIYDPINSTILNTYTIKLYDIIYNTGNPVVSSVTVNGITVSYQYSRTEVITMVNNAIQSSNLFTSNSQISQYDISGNVINANNTCFQLSLMFDRNKVLYQPNSKIVVIFPQEIAANYGNITVWKYQTGITNCCFYFKTLVNEYYLLTAELPIVQSDIVVDASNINVQYNCWTPTYMIDSSNNFKFNIPNQKYTINQYIAQLNSSLKNSPDVSNNGITLGTDTNFSITNTYFTTIMDIRKIFTEKNYLIYFDASSVLCDNLGFIPTKDLSGSITSGTTYTDSSGITHNLTGCYPLDLSNIFNGSFVVSGAYNLSSPYICTIYPDQSSPNRREPPHTINLSSTEYRDYIYLLNDIKNSINRYTIINSDISDVQIPYVQSLFTWNPPIGNIDDIINITFTMTINYLLNEGNYIMNFNPPDVSNSSNPWYIFGIEPSYNLFTYTIDVTNSTPSKPVYFSYAQFQGTKPITENQIQIVDGSNTILISANYDPSGGAYTPTGANDISFNIPPGKYTTEKLCTAINTGFSSNPYSHDSNIYIILDASSNQKYVQIRLNVSRIYTSADYNLVFYDPFSFVACNSNLQGIQSATWDTTLGWILGYRDYTSYSLTYANQTINVNTGIPYYLQSRNSVYQYTQLYDGSNVTHSIVQLSADTTLTTSLYNYFVISLDDYNQNHINDGLVTITRSQTSIQMPYYATTSRKICDPTTNTLVNRSIPQSDSDNLSSNQIYSVNQSSTSQTNQTPVLSAGPFIKDLFGYIPIKPGTNGTYFIEYGGGLQLQERLYFGPVNIRKMSIQLMTDRGDYLDLNGSNWSFSFICEQLYRSGNSSSNK